MTRFGGYADTVVVPQGQVFGKPDALSHEQAAALPVNYRRLAVACGDGGAVGDETV